MLDADHRGFRNRGMTDCQIFEVDRRDPLAAGLDDVLRTVGDLHVAVRADGGDGAGIEISLRVEELASLVFEVRLSDRRTAYLEAATGVPIPGQPPSHIVGDLQLDAEWRVPLLALGIEARLTGELRIAGLQRANGADWRHLGHSPA